MKFGMEKMRASRALWSCVGNAAYETALSYLAEEHDNKGGQ